MAGVKGSCKAPISLNRIKRRRVRELKANYKMEHVPDTEFMEWFRRNYATGYPVTIIDG